MSTEFAADRLCIGPHFAGIGRGRITMCELVGQRELFACHPDLQGVSAKSLLTLASMAPGAISTVQSHYNVGPDRSQPKVRLIGLRREHAVVTISGHVLDSAQTGRKFTFHPMTRQHPQACYRPVDQPAPMYGMQPV